jgi:hypothetical protein
MVAIKVITKKYKKQIKKGISPLCVARKIATIHAVNHTINKGN